MIRKILILLTFLHYACLLNAQWQQVNGLNTDLSIKCFVINDTIHFAGPDNRGLYLSTNNGSDWIPTDLSNHSVISFAVGNDHFYAGTWGGDVYSSINKGNNWNVVSKVSPGLNNNHIYSLAVCGTNIYAGTYGGHEGGGVYLSSDYGSTWSHSGLKGNSILSMTVNGPYIFAGTDGGGVYLSTDSGKNWTVKNAGLAYHYIYSLVTHEGRIYAGTSSGGLYVSSNNGDSWDLIGLMNYTVRSIAISGSKIFAGTWEGGVYMSSNNGINWTSINSNLINNNIISLAIIGDKIFAGIFNGGMWKRSFSDFTDVEKIHEDKSIILNLDLYNKYLTIDNLSFNEVYKLTIYDINGSERIKREAQGVKALVNINHLQKGLYILKIDNQKSIETRKFIIK